MECMEAVANLTPEDSYIVVCDDDSTDNTEQVFNSWQDKRRDKRIDYFRNEEILGISKTKNILIKQLCAHPGVDDIFLIEDDVIPLSEKWYEIFLKTAWEHFVAHLLFMPTETKYGKTHLVETGKYPIAWKQYCSGMVMYFRRALLEEVGGFNEVFHRYGYDHNELTARCLLAQQYHPGVYPHCLRSETDRALLSKDVAFAELRKPIPSSTTKEQKRDYANANARNYLHLMDRYKAAYEKFRTVSWQDRRWHRESAYFNAA